MEDSHKGTEVTDPGTDGCSGCGCLGLSIIILVILLFVFSYGLGASLANLF